MNQKSLTLLTMQAHPDDEVFGTGGVYCRAAAEGIHTVLLCSTLGEEGKIHIAERDTEEERAALARTREEELRRAADLLGIDDIYFLGYRDSGMLGTPENDNPANFLNAPVLEAVGRVVRRLRQVRPDVFVAYDRGGGYGHPDHVTVHRIGTAAVAAAADPAQYPEAGPAWTVPKFYYTANPRSRWDRAIEAMQRAGMEPPMHDAEYDLSAYATPEEEITTVVDVRPYVARKLTALRVHETQIGEDSFLDRLPAEALEAFFGQEEFVRVSSTVPVPEKEDDLFAGLR